jgi:ribonuclease HII
MPVPKTLPPVPALLCGVDEAGRGPLAGSVFAAAVVLDPAKPIEGLADSKVLTEAARERLALEIRSRALAWSVAVASVEEIDTINILQATFLAMRRALQRMAALPDIVLIDGNQVPPGLGCKAETIVGGDARSYSIAAASIFAKVTRDRYMCRLAETFPGYGWETNVGYKSPAHLAALKRLGPTPHHRRSFAPVRACLGEPVAAIPEEAATAEEISEEIHD